nr:CAZy families GH32 protein [uncultured Ruminococcus sp.]
MLLGARDRCDNGFIMVYNSEDKLHWKLHSVIRSAQHFGYMWECPDRMDFEDTYGKGMSF